MVRAIMIVETAGNPANHVKEYLSNHIMVLQKVKDIKVHTIKISDPKEIEGSNGIFTCFAEADFEVPSFSRLADTVFDFMPSSVEVLEPGKVSMDLHEASSLLNNISGRMHRYDEIAKIAHFKIKQLSGELQKRMGAVNSENTTKNEEQNSPMLEDNKKDSKPKKSKIKKK